MQQRHTASRNSNYAAKTHCIKELQIAWRKHDIEELHDIHGGINPLKCIVKNVAWGPLMEKDIEHFVKNFKDCNKQRQRLKDYTDKWKKCGPWDKLHID